MVSNRSFRHLLAGATSILLSACVSSHVLVGNPRPPISPDQVRVYLDPPGHYDKIAIIQTSSRDSFALTAQGKMNKVIERLKDQAAELGANGILLQDIGDRAAGTVGSGFASASYNGGSASAFRFGSSATMYQKSGDALAIYVPGQ